MVLTGVFEVKINNKIFRFNEYNDVPESFDHLITCNFDYKEGPHTDEEHEELSKLNYYFKELMKREKK